MSPKPKVKRLPRYVEEVATGKVLRVFDYHIAPYILCVTRHSRMDRDAFRERLREGSFRPLKI